MAREAETAFGDVAETAEEVERSTRCEFANRATDFVLLDADAVPTFDNAAVLGTAANGAYDVVIGFAERFVG